MRSSAKTLCYAVLNLRRQKSKNSVQIAKYSFAQECPIYSERTLPRIHFEHCPEEDSEQHEAVPEETSSFSDDDDDNDDDGQHTVMVVR